MAEQQQGPDYSQPFYQYGQDGSVVGGYGATVPSLTPGTPENAMFLESDFLKANPEIAGIRKKVANDFNAATKPDYSGQGFKVPPAAITQQFADQAEATRTLTSAKLETEHNSEHVLNFIGEDVRGVINAYRDQGDFRFKASKDMSDDDIIAFAEARGVDPGVVNYLKTSKNNPLTNYGIDVMASVRQKMFRYDERYQSGKAIADNLQENLFHLKDGPIKAQAMRNYSFYRAQAEEAVIPQFTQALASLIGSIGESVAVDLPKGVFEAIRPGGTSDQSLSPEYIGNQEKRTRAMAIMERADRLARSGLYDTIKNNSDDPSKVIAKAGEFVRNPEVQQVMLDMQALKDDGAFVPASRFSRLFSVFDGGIKATQGFYRMFAASVDPNSLFFNMEASLNEKGGLPWVNAINNTAKGTKRYQLVRDDEVLRMTHLLEQNYNQANLNADKGGAESLWLTVAENTDDPNLKAAWTDAAKFAGGLYNQGVAERSSFVLDPTVIVGGAAAKLVGSAAKGAAKVAFIDSALAAKAATLGDDILTAVRATEKGAEVLEPAVKALQDRLRVMGVAVSDNEAIALAMSNNAQSWEVRAALGGVTSEAETIRRTVGQLSSQNKAVRTTVQEFLAEAKTASGKVPKPTAAAARPVAGTTAKVAGKGAEFTGRFLDNLGELLLGSTPEGVSRMSLEGMKAMRLGRMAGGAAAGGAVGVAYGLIQEGPEGLISAGGQFFKGAAIATGLGVGAKIVGPVLQRNGRLIANVSNEIASGERKGVSTFLQAADRLDTGAQAIKKTDPKKALQMANDASQLRNLNAMGYEEALTQTLVVGTQGAAGIGAGATLAWSNSRDSMSAGAGMGFGGALIAGAAAKLGAMLPSGVQANRDLGVMATSMYYLNRASPEQRANFFEMFNREVGVDANGRFQNKDKAVRLLDAYNLLNGSLGQAGFELANPGAMQGATVATRHANIDMDALKTVAGEMYPNDPAMAAAYAESLVKRVNTQNNQFATIAAANARLERNTKATETNLRSIESVKEGIAKAEAAGLNKRAAELKSELSAKEAKQEVYAKEKATLEQARDLEKSRLVDKEAISREADRKGLKDEERAKFTEAETLRQTALLDPIRPGELRTGTAGNQIRQIADGFYINDANGKVMIDYTRADALTMVHEGFEAVLRDDSLKVLLPELVNFMYADPSSPTSTKRLLSDQNRQRFFDLYTSDLTPENAAQYKKDLSSAEKLFKETGDYSAILPFVQEASAWWLAVMHDSYPPGYANILGAAPTSGYQGRIFGRLFEAEKAGKFSRRPGELMKALMETGGAREVTGVLASEFEAFVNPEYGWLADKSRKLIRSRLESNGMIFEDASDGTVRGYFRQNGETINNPVMGDIYRVISRNQSGGKRSAGVDILSNPRVPEGVKIEWIKQNGFDHMLTDPASGEPVRIQTPEEQTNTNTRINENIRDSLGGVPTDQRGTTTTINPSNGQVIFHGIPSPAEIAVIKNNPDLPPVIRDNLVGIMEGIKGGKSNAVLRAQYINVKTRQKAVGTEARLVVPEETGGPVVEQKEFIPLGLVFGMTDRLPGGRFTPGKVKIPSVSVLSFDISSAKGNLNTIRNKGLFDNTGMPIKDIDGSDMTPARFRELFPTDGDYWNATNVYLTHLQAAGKIDTTSNRPVMPAGYEPSAVKLASLAGDPTNIKLGESMRNAIRFGLGIDARKDMVLINPAGYGKVMRDINQTISNFRIDGMGKITATGETYSIDHNTLGWAQANMAPSTWRALNAEGLNALKATDGWNTTQALGHPNNNFRIVEDSRTTDGKTEKRVRIYDAATGNLIEHSATDVKTAREFVKDRMATDSANSEVAAAVAELARREVEAAEKAQPTPVTRAERPEPSPGLALKEQQAYNKAKADKIAAAARRIIKENEVKFIRTENEKADVQRQYEDQAALQLDAASAARAKLDKVAAEALVAAEARRRVILNDMGRQFADKANEYNTAERVYFGDPIKVNNAIKEVDKTARGLVDLEKNLSIPLQQLGVEIRTQSVVQALPLPIYRRALVFDKRPLSKVPVDVMRARTGMRDVAEATTMQTAKGMMQEANNYVLSNALGQVIVSEMRSRQGADPYRMFTVYAAGTKVKLLETESFQKALQQSLSDAYKQDAKARAVAVPAKAEVGMALEIAGRARQGQPFVPPVIQRQR